MYGWRGRVEDPLRRPDLDELAQVHDGEPVGDVADDAEVVRDHEVGEPEPLRRSRMRFRIWARRRDVEPRGRLVGDEELGLKRERARDADAPRLPARELVRVLAAELGRELDHLQQLVDRIPLLARHVVDPVGLGQQVGDAQARAQARVRVLEDHLHPPRADGVGRRRAVLVTSLPVEDDLALGRRARAGGSPSRASSCPIPTRRRGRASRRGGSRGRRRRRRGPRRARGRGGDRTQPWRSANHVRRPFTDDERVAQRTTTPS